MMMQQRWLVSIRVGAESYHFVFDEQTHRQALRLAGNFAADPALNFTWYAAAKVCREIRGVVAAALQAKGSK